MKLFKSLWRNAGKTYSLQKKYYVTTTCVGLFGLFTFVFPLFLGVVIFLGKLLGAKGGVPINEDPMAMLLVVLMLPTFFVSLVIGMLMAASIFSVFMLLFGKFNVNEAKNYVLYSDYPDRWLK